MRFKQIKRADTEGINSIPAPCLWPGLRKRVAAHIGPVL